MYVYIIIYTNTLCISAFPISKLMKRLYFKHVVSCLVKNKPRVQQACTQTTHIDINVQVQVNTQSPFICFNAFLCKDA